VDNPTPALAPARTLGTVPFRWHLARWRHADPGGRGLVALAVLTALMFVPVERLGVDLSWESQLRLLVLAGALAAAAAFGRHAAHADDVEPWLVQLGHSPADWALARWGTNLAALTALALLWSACVAIIAGAFGSGVAWMGVLGLFVHLALCGLVYSTLFLLLGAAGVTQTVELGLLLLLGTLVLPLAGDALPPPLTKGLTLLLPPLGPIAELRTAVVDLRWRDAATAGLHLATWCGLAVAASVALLRRRVPQ
jgi:hypothetical protein